jgi:hypothetical protein
VFRSIRRLVLLLILFVIAVGSWQARQRIAEWRYPVRVVVYPIVGDDTGVSRNYVAGLTDRDFEFIETYVNEEAARYDIKPEFGTPLSIDLAPRVDSLPPPPPVGGNVLEIMWWSLRLRYWAWQVDTWAGTAPQVRVFVAYFDPKEHEVLAHSLGIEKGAIGVVNAFASEKMAGSNNVVIAHELLHTMGATDKYDPETTQPRFPDGYAQPDAEPLHPQRFAEIMGGRIPLSDSESRIPTSLNSTLVGEDTAREINWLK